MSKTKHAKLDGIRKRIDAAIILLGGISSDVEMLAADNAASPPPAAIRKSKKGLCLYCGQSIEDGKTKTRGLHSSCYVTVRRAMEKSGESDESAIRKGKILPVGKSGRKQLRAPAATEILDANELSQDDTKKAAAMLEIAKAKSEKDKRESPSVN